MKDFSDTPLAELRRELIAPRDLVARSFRMYELTRSDIAARQGIDNALVADQELRAAVHLARQVLQPIRDAFGPYSPNSVYRGQALERVLKRRPGGWISTSQHTRGEACDVEVSGQPTLELARWAADTLADFDQIICECYDPARGPNSGWVHISLKPPGSGANRRNTLSYVRDPATGLLAYVSGLRADTA